MLKLLYFASLREQLNMAQEQLELDQSLSRVSDLKQLLIQRGDNWKSAFEGDIPLLVSINQQMASDEAEINDGDEIAFFPPVTGG